MPVSDFGEQRDARSFCRSSDLNKMNLYVYGSCHDTSHNGGYGYMVVVNDSISLKGSSGRLATTDTEMELTAIIEGLKVIPEEYAVVIYSTSAFIVNMVKNRLSSNWEPSFERNTNDRMTGTQKLWVELLAVIRTHPFVQFVLVDIPDTNSQIEACRRLAASAISDLVY